jgi:hypothetical protein
VSCSLQLAFNILGLEDLLEVSLHTDGFFAKQVLVAGFQEVLVQAALLVDSSNDRSSYLEAEMRVE